MDTDILKGTRVIDFSRVLAGPYATRCLADFGAEVIKVQSATPPGGTGGNTGGYFAAWNRNKKSITLDLSFSEARKLILDLVSISDVVVENFSPRVMVNWGLTYDRLKAVKPGIIMLRMSGMGQTGPWKDFVAYGPTVQSLGGLTYLSSASPDSPTGIGYAHADSISGLYGALAVLAALEYRDRTGKGQVIDLSEYEAVATLVGPALLDVFANDRGSGAQARRSTSADNDPPSACPCGCFRCRGDDRWCVIAVYDEKQWRALCRILDQKEWQSAERFSSVAKRRLHTVELDEQLEHWTVQQPAETVVRELQRGGVPAGVVQDARDLANDPHLLARDFFVTLEHPSLGSTTSDRSPVFFEPGAPGNWKPAPLFGADNRYVFCGLLGFSEEQLSSYIEKKIIG